MAVGRPFGGLKDTIAALRRRVRSGGWMVIDDVVLAAGVTQGPHGYEDCGDLVSLITQFLFREDSRLLHLEPSMGRG